MTLSLDPELLRELAAMAGSRTAAPPVARGDWRALRERSDEGLARLTATLPELPSVKRTPYTAISRDGTRIDLRWYASDSHDLTTPGPAVVFLHGGGMICGSVDLYDRHLAGYAAESGVPMLAVDYRRAPEYPHPCPVEDSFAALIWLRSHATELGVDPNRVAVMGDSAGGGITAGLTLVARERDVPVAKQLLIYPMLDDRTTVPDPALLPFAGWSYDDNYTGWHALLGDSIGGPDVPETAAPARAADLSGLPPAYLEVGGLDIFRDETIDYARRLAASGVPVELHVHPGCPHGYDQLSAAPDVVRRARADRMRALGAF
ncbi:alpha/beta hydrolase [Nocardia miyunensis]|uniref:alpha/beta hydrolase n=1 Tax=Nocardia miyunensis TaxID=282684 RepID=UPI000835340D|nr:alpha/beta hydrolase [Nocardia miyunensis]